MSAQQDPLTQQRLNHSDIAALIHKNARIVRQNEVTQSLSGHALRRGEVALSAQGALVASTGKFTGRSANDKFILRDATTENTVWWDNTGAMSAGHFDLLLADMIEHTIGRAVFEQQLFAGADPKSRYNVDVFSESAWHALFIRHLLIHPNDRELSEFATNVSVVHMPDFEADPARHGTRTSTAIVLDFSRNIVLICGTAYAGEIKKSVFSLFNFHAPAENILPMHCSANVGKKGDTALFFGLSGTGKTTLSTSPDRALVGDDEHGWSIDNVFNLEGGCYAKAINLTEENEPEIYHAAMQAGTILENVTLDKETGNPDFFDTSVTENTRIAYPLSAIPNRVVSGVAPLPRNIVLLTADAFGVLPPLSRLSAEQAIYYFLSGYTAKVAGTERGIVEPEATFSACFGAPFMARHPADYGELLADRLAKGQVNCWLLNTGWTGGPYGVGKRIALKTTRKMLEAALDGDLDDVEYRTDHIFSLAVPTAIDGVEPDLLEPEKTWSDAAAYREQANRLLDLFAKNFVGLGPKAAAVSKILAASSNAA
ncbi:Phosphoenolpyruvate carboxykinase [ATP] [hydrothermal vent metagenome]|uniref:phosphoenolpyruvate carboxykinase (ATP) n=1 Tax=hydrothermal vent metagenome TaxID=652676 RepID=A0A3B0TYD4_9ZZZZ